MIVGYAGLGVGLLIYEIYTSEAFQNGNAIFALNLVTCLMEITAIYLVFTGNAREWFAKTAPA